MPKQVRCSYAGLPMYRAGTSTYFKHGFNVVQSVSVEVEHVPYGLDVAAFSFPEAKRIALDERERLTTLELYEVRATSSSKPCSNTPDFNQTP